MFSSGHKNAKGNLEGCNDFQSFGYKLKDGEELYNPEKPHLCDQEKIDKLKANKEAHIDYLNKM